MTPEPTSAPLPAPPRAAERTAELDRMRRNRRRSARILTGLAIISLFVLIGADSADPTSPSPTWVAVLIGLVAACGGALAVGVGVPRLHLWLGVGLGATTVLPWVAPIIHRYGDASSLALAVGVTAFAAVVTAAITPVDWSRWAVLITATAFVLVSLVAGIIQATGHDIGAFHMVNQREWIGTWQLRGILGHPNTLAIVACMALALQIQALRLRWSRLPKWGQRVAVVVGPACTIVVIIWSQSRTGWIAAVLLAVVLLPPLDRADLSRWAAAICGLVVLLPLVPPLLASWLGVSFSGRSYAWQLAESHLIDGGIFGVGPRLFSPSYWRLVDTLAQPEWEPVHAHNEYLHALVLMGLVGVVVVVLTFGLLAFVAYLVRTRDQRWALATVLVLAVFSGVEPTLGIGDVPATFLPSLMVAVVFGSSAMLVTRPRVISLADPPSSIVANI